MGRLLVGNFYASNQYWFSLGQRRNKSNSCWSVTFWLIPAGPMFRRSIVPLLLTRVLLLHLLTNVPSFKSTATNIHTQTHEATTHVETAQSRSDERRIDDEFVYNGNKTKRKYINGFADVCAPPLRSQRKIRTGTVVNNNGLWSERVGIAINVRIYRINKTKPFKGQQHVTAQCIASPIEVCSANLQIDLASLCKEKCDVGFRHEIQQKSEKAE